MNPEKVRVSIGTAAVLGLMELKLDTEPTTAYLMTYTQGSCIANCAFCAQARESSSEKTLLSRVVWPVFPTYRVVESLGEKGVGVIERVCIQIINYPGFVDDVFSLIKGVKDSTNLPVSIDTCPLMKEEMKKIRELGAERISIPLDAATPTLFDKVKGKTIRGPYRWEKHLEALSNALEIFGTDNVMSNLIIGLGESEIEAVRLIQEMMDRGIKIALYAFTPIPDTKLAELSQPPLETYRRIQLARHVITKGLSRFEDMEFDEKDRLVSLGKDMDIGKILGNGEALKTTGCPGCNRPYYNERPSGPFYNYPRDLTQEELILERKRLEEVLK